MRTLWKAAAAVIALGALAAAAPANAQDYDYPPGPGYYGDDNGDGGYCDDYGCPDDYWNMPVYYGQVYFDGDWIDGPLYYRDWYGARQFWLHGGWHGDQWRGARPGWWHEGRYGPALGRQFYQNHGFQDRGNFGHGFQAQPQNRSGNGRQDWINRGNVQPQAQPQRNGGRHGGGGRNDWRAHNNAQPQQQRAPQPQNGGGHRDHGGGDSHDWHR